MGCAQSRIYCVCVCVYMGSCAFESLALRWRFFIIYSAFCAYTPSTVVIGALLTAHTHAAMMSRLFALLLLAVCATGIRVVAPTPPSAALCSRRSVLPVAFGLAFASRVLPALADDKSKTDKKFISCISECVYDQQKIAKGIGEVEYVTKKDALALCKPKCAKSPEQLLTGKPKK